MNKIINVSMGLNEQTEPEQTLPKILQLFD